MDLKALDEENFPQVEKKIRIDNVLRDALLEDLATGLESIGYYIPEDAWEIMEIRLRRVLLDLKPLTAAELPGVEVEIRNDPALQEAMLEDMESGLESLGYYLSEELWDKMDKQIKRCLGKGVKALKQEVDDLVMRQEGRHKKRFKAEIVRGGE